MKKSILLLLLFSISIIFGNFSGQETIKLVLTSNVNGETDPCG